MRLATLKFEFAPATSVIMADEESKPEGEDAEGQDEAKKGGVLPWIAVTLLAGGAGVALPFLMPAPADGQTDEPPEPPPYEIPEPEEMAFVPFESVVVNLDEGAMTRYLRITVALQVAKEKELEITTKVEEQKALLKDWIINQISDKGLDDIRGRAGQNRLRREIRDKFNSVLFPDGYDQIYDVLFDEYNVQ